MFFTAHKQQTADPSCCIAPPLQQVKNYFNTTGYERWRKIYGETEDVNKVQLDIRTGHAQTVDKVLRWVDEEGGVKGVTVADCGCGTGEWARLGGWC
jgi:magnesium-protoporphyrin O-methyltransferase